MPDNQSTITSPAGQPLPWRRIIVLTLLAAGAITSVFAYRNYTDPARIRALAEQYFSRFVNGRVTIGAARFSFVSGVRLFDVTVEQTDDVSTPSDSAAPPIPTFWCRELELKHNPLAALLGRLQVDSIVALEPTCAVIHDSTTGRTNISRLLRPMRMRSPDDTHELPTVELRDARIRVLAHHEAGERLVEDLRVTLRARQSQQDPRLYDIVWHGRDDASPGGYSQLELHTGLVRNVRGGLPSMSIEAVLLAVNARFDGVGAWSNVLGLHGRVRARDYNLIERAESGEPRSATIELTDAAISIPVSSDEQPLPRHERYLRFDNVNGSIVVTTESLKADFTGRFHGGECSVQATLRSDLTTLRSLDDVDFDVRLTIHDFELPRPDANMAPEEARFIQRFVALARAYRNFDPMGRVNLELAAEKRAGADQPVVVKRAVIDAQSARASCHLFPYRGDNLTGRIEITPAGVTIQNLRAQHHGAEIALDGWMDKLDRCAEASFYIRGHNVPLEDELFAALRLHHRVIARRFRPTGNVDIEVILNRAPCEETTPSTWAWQVTIGLDHSAATLDDFPFPLEDLTGEVVIQRDRADIHDVRGRPASLGRRQDPAETVTINGHVLFAEGAVSELDVRIEANDLVIDERLFRAVPQAMREGVEVFQPAGRLDVQTGLSFDELDQRIIHDSCVFLQNATIQHREFPIPITNVTGTVELSSDRFEIPYLAGHYQGASLSASGHVQKSPSSFKFIVIGQAVSFDDRLLASLPDEWRARLGDWKLLTPVDLEVTASRSPQPPESPWVFHTAVRMEDAELKHPRLPAGLRNVNGDVSVGSDGVRCSDLRAHYGDADVAASFKTERTSLGTEGTIYAVVRGLRLDQNVRALLPEQFRTAWERAMPQGRVDILVEDLRFAQANPQGPRTWSLDATADLYEVGFPALLRANEITGTLTANGTLVDRLGGLLVKGKMRLPNLNLFGRGLSNLEADWSLVHAADGEGYLSLDHVNAALYDGSVTGDVRIGFEAGAPSYDLSATMQGVELGALLNAGRPPNDPPLEVRGLSNAHFYLSGIVGVPSSRRGGGRLDLQDGYIYRMPIFVAVLNVLNLSLPEPGASQDLTARFYLTGNQIELNEIILRGQGLELVGSGTMVLPDRFVNLTFMNANPHRWARLPVLADFVEGASKELVAVQVNGPIDRPNVAARPLAGISDEFKRLFQSRKPEPIRPTSAQR